MPSGVLTVDTIDRDSIRPSGSAVRRAVYIGAGSLSVACGTAGLFVPGLPTTVFLLLASWFFARSSPRLHGQLLSQPRLGPPLRRFLEERAKPARAKGAAIASMWTGIGVGILAARSAGPYVQVALLAAGVVGSLVLLFWVRTSSVDD